MDTSNVAVDPMGHFRPPLIPWDPEGLPLDPLGRRNYRKAYLIMLNIAKGTTDPRVEFISQVQTQIFIKFHLQNLDQESTSKF